MALIGGQNQQAYAIATLLGHITLVTFGFYYAKSRHQRFLDTLREDLKR